MKKKTIYPPLLLEAIIRANDWQQTPELTISVRRFHTIIENLNSEYEIDFDFIELLDFSERFHTYHQVLVEEYELHLHNSMYEKIRDTLEWHNRMYDAADQVDRIQQILRKLK